MAPCEKGSTTVPVITTSLEISNKNKISYFFKKINGIQQSAKKKKKGICCITPGNIRKSKIF